MGFIEDFKKGYYGDNYSDCNSDCKLVKHIKSFVVCSECGLNNENNCMYCIHCGHKLKKIPSFHKSYREYCVFCGKSLKNDECFCGHCGKEVVERKRVKVCPVCGNWCGSERYCWNCGHDNYKVIDIYGFLSSKKCPNCDMNYDSCYQYCNECGSKLVKR